MDEAPTPNAPMDQQILSAAQGLLRHSGGLVRHQDEIARATGEHFNLFHILGVEHYEVSTHSALLRDLLDPRGSHGQGATFLKCFLAIMDLKEPLDAHTVKVDREFGIGPCTESKGGRLDLLIRYDQQRIAIENKIYAEEQDHWVRRYRAWLGDGGCLLYLTLFRDEPVQIDKGDEKAVRCISYASDILKWLEVCRKEVATVPIVRESLTQYIHLIKKLTHQNTSNRMNEEIIKSVVQSNENFTAYRALRDADLAIKGHIILNLGERVRKLVPEGIEVLHTPKGESNKWEEFAFSMPGLVPRHLMAAIAFDKDCYHDCHFGFSWTDNERATDSVVVQQVLQKHFKAKFGDCELNNDKWPAFLWWNDMKKWDDDILERMQFGDGIDKILTLVKDLQEVAHSFSEEMSRIE